MNFRQELRPGKEAEEIASAYLLGKDYRILAMNYRTRRGEVDIICQHDKTLVFVEVKSGAQDKLGAPALRVNLAKQKKLLLAASAYLIENESGFDEIRFDVISMLRTPRNEWHIEHILDAFRAEEG
jgi:putative endonuclease